MIISPILDAQARPIFDSDRLVQGRKKMSELKAVFMGLARDNADTIRHTLDNIRRLGESFETFSCIFFENDSRDNTLSILKEFQENEGKQNHIVHVLHESGLATNKRPSISFLADCRNKCLNFLKARRGTEYRDFDVTIVVDLDMAYEWDIRGFEDTFSHYSGFDFVGSNGIAWRDGTMYDLFAFRTREHCTPPCEFSDWLCHFCRTVRRKYLVENPNGLFPVLSCFGGLGIYRTEAIVKAEYKSVKEDCEHVHLHEMMRNAGHSRQYMNPKQIIVYDLYERNQDKIICPRPQHEPNLMDRHVTIRRAEPQARVLAIRRENRGLPSVGAVRIGRNK